MKKRIWILSISLTFLCLSNNKESIGQVINTNEVTRYDQFRDIPLNTKPEGWLLEFLRRQQSGLTGRPDVLSYPFNTSLWGGVIDRIGDKRGADWWRYEQTAYYTDGLIRLGYLLGNDSLIQKSKEGIKYTLDRPQDNGRLGPSFFTSQWPIAVFFRVLEAEYSVTKDPRIVEALHRHYLSYTPKELGDAKRAIVNIEGALWTYGKTGDQRLLELAEKSYAIGGFELNLEKCLSSEKDSIHGVTYMEMAKLPAILYTYTNKQLYLDAAVNAMKKLERDHMLPDGVPSSSEFLSGKDPLVSHETCDITDYTWALGYLLMATGDAHWADNIERAVFNAGPGAVSKDFKNLQYFSSVNQVIATGISNHNPYKHGTTWMAYWPCHETECCAGNVHRFMPNYITRMWMRDSAGNPVATLYGPSLEKVKLSNGTEMTIKETTSYPFSEKIDFSFEVSSPVKMPFKFRIPVWCDKPQVLINGKAYKGNLKKGSFITIDREFKNGDRISLNFPMEAKMVKWGRWGGLVERGPLLYAYAVPEAITIDTATYPRLDGKRSNDPAFPALDIRPKGNWNYALDMDSTDFSKKIKVVKTKKTGYPLDPGNAPVVIRVPARKVNDWTLEQGRFTPPLPLANGFEVDSKREMITLVPYGSTRLRVTVFPIAEQ
ncbi:beta-L-arabinofuranosidase domain-containing protein [Parapedobacter deserti]|uniref:Beta-L-arabinofuranosidase domain-containing protein n=1 Tax=Parapedobacter deserti TaxID=1912957 RepID=A0ABV7JHY3_9SPHI